MDTIRYGAALMLVAVLPPAFGFWFSVHPFIRFWRRVGAPVTYTIHIAGLVATTYGLFRLRGPLLAVDYGTSWPLVVLALVLYGLAIVVERKCRRYLTLRTLMGIPEVNAPQEGPGKLLCEGIYARVRHPRYLGVMLASAAFACLANYLAGWLVLAGLVPVVLALTLIEEKELVERFGADYVAYRARVPRLVPRFGGSRA